jgi:ankyrin repeat protein
MMSTQEKLGVNSRNLSNNYIVVLLRIFFVCGGIVGISLSANAQVAALADAVEHRDEAQIRQLLDQRHDINARQVDGMTALHWAVYHDDEELTRLLIRAGAEVNVENRYGVLPLALAATNGSAALTSVLLDAGAGANETLAGGETVLMVAARSGNLEAVQALLAAGADPNAQERREQTALMWAAAEGHAPVAKVLMDAGADINYSLGSGFTALFFSVREGNLDVTRLLVAAGADVNELLQSRRERTQRAGNNASEQPINQGISPLLMAVRNGHFELAIDLVRAGADPNDRRSGFTPLHTISWVRKPDASDRGDPAPIGSGNLSALDFVKEIIALGADVNLPLIEGAPRQPNSSSQISSGGASAFLLAADRADVPLMNTLLELGANPFWSNLNSTTALMAAAGLGTSAPEEEAGTEDEALAATALMLKLGAEVNLVNERNETAMHGAAFGMFPAVAKLLAQHGADPYIWNRENYRGWTPLFIAEGYRYGLPRPSRPTIEVIETMMTEAGITLGGQRPEVIDIYAVPLN